MTIINSSNSPLDPSQTLDTNNLGEPFSELTSGVPKTLFPDLENLSIESFAQRPGALPPTLIRGLDERPLSELQTDVRSYVDTASLPLVPALYSEPDQPLSHEGWSAVREFVTGHVQGLLDFTEGFITSGRTSMSEADVAMFRDSIDILGGIEKLQFRLGLSDTMQGQIVSIALSAANTLSTGLAGVIADPELGMEHLDEVFNTYQSLGTVLNDPSRQQLHRGVVIASNIEVLSDSIVRSIVENRVFTDLDVPRLPDGRFDPEQLPMRLAVNQHDLQMDATFVRLLNPDAEREVPLMDTGHFDLYPGPPNGFDFGFNLADYLGVVGNPEFQTPQPLPVEVQPPDETPIEPVVEEPKDNRLDENDPVIRPGKPTFLESNFDESSAVDEGGEEAEAPVSQEPDEPVPPAFENDANPVEPATPFEQQAAAEPTEPVQLWRPISMDFHRIENSAVDLNEVFNKVVLNQEALGDGDLLFDTTLMASYTLFLEDLAVTLQDITLEEAVEIGGVVATLGSGLYESMAKLEELGLADTPAFSAAQVVTELLSSVFYAGEAAEKDAVAGAKIMNDLIQPITLALSDVFRLSMEQYAETGIIDLNIHRFFQEARDMAYELYSEVYDYNAARAATETDEDEE